MTDPRRRRESRTTTFRLPVDLLERFREAADADRRTRGKAAEVALEMYIARVEAETGKSSAAA